MKWAKLVVLLVLGSTRQQRNAMLEKDFALAPKNTRRAVPSQDSILVRISAYIYIHEYMCMYATSLLINEQYYARVCVLEVE